MKKYLLTASIFLALGLTSCKGTNVDFKNYGDFKLDERYTVEVMEVDSAYDDRIVKVADTYINTISGASINGKISEIRINGGEFYKQDNQDSILYDSFFNKIDLVDNYKDYKLSDTFIIPMNKRSQLYCHIFDKQYSDMNNSLDVFVVKEFRSNNDSFRMISNYNSGQFVFMSKSYDISEELKISPEYKLLNDRNNIFSIDHKSLLFYNENEYYLAIADDTNTDTGIRMIKSERDDLFSILNNGILNGEYFYEFDVESVNGITNDFDVYSDDRRYKLDYKRYKLTDYNTEGEEIKLSFIPSNTFLRGNDGSVLIFGNRIENLKPSAEYYYVIIDSNGKISKPNKNVDSVYDSIYDEDIKSILDGYDYLGIAYDDLIVGSKSNSYYYFDKLIGAENKLGSLIPISFKGSQSIYFYTRFDNSLNIYNTSLGTIESNTVEMIDEKLGLYALNGDLMMLDKKIADVSDTYSIRVISKATEVYLGVRKTSIVIKCGDKNYNVVLSQNISK